MVVGRICICIRCALECNTAEAIAAVQGSCFCLSSLPTSTAATASSCHTSCSADAAQLCGGTDGAGAAAFASVYRTPATLSTEPGSSVLPCLSQRGAAATPQLFSVSPLVAPFNSTLTLVGTNLTGLASGSGSGRAVPTVNVCGGRTCEVTAYNATHVQCRMPMCSAAFRRRGMCVAELSNGGLQLTESGRFVLQRCGAFGVALSYRPMLRQLETVRHACTGCVRASQDCVHAVYMQCICSNEKMRNAVCM